MRRPVLPCLLLFLLPLLTAAPSGQQAAATHGTATAPAVAAGTAARPAGSKIWIGREAEFEAFLATAPVERLEQIPVGVTKPMRAFVEPGGPATSFVFKPLTPSRAHDYWESYKAEIAAYELDKLLGLGMVPPTVERRLKGKLGSAQLWVDNCSLVRDRDTTKAPDIGAWNRQVYRQRIWDNLTGNIDRNQGNLLVDEAWNLILIDHSRAFTATTRMPFEMHRIDREFFERLKALDEATVKARVGKWLFDGPKPLLKRRDRIVQHFEKLIAERGEQAVLIP